MRAIDCTDGLSLTAIRSVVSGSLPLSDPGPLQLREMRAGEETEQATRQRARLDRRAAEEEELMMRVPLAKKELKGMRAAQRAGLSGGALLDDFADDVADLVKVRPHVFPIDLFRNFSV